MNKNSALIEITTPFMTPVWLEVDQSTLEEVQHEMVVESTKKEALLESTL